MVPMPKVPTNTRNDLKAAIRSDNRTKLQALISSVEGIDRNELLAVGLLTSTQDGNVECAAALLAKGADPNYAHPGHRDRPIPFLVAMKHGHDELVQLLVDHGANVCAKDQDGRTALMLTKSVPCAKKVIDKFDKAFIDSVDNDRKSALMHALDVDVVNFLLEHKPDLELKDKNGYSALYISVMDSNDSRIAEALINGGADIEAVDEQGRTILVTAIWKSRFEVLGMLVTAKVDVKKIDKRRRNALHHLASDTRRSDEGSETPDYPDDEKILKLLLAQGIEPNAKDDLERTALHWSAVTGNSKLTAQLLASGSAVDATEHRHRTALHLAAAKDHPKTLKVLLDNRAQVNFVSTHGWVPLHAACESYNASEQTVSLLLEHKANPRQATRSGRTPLHLAAQVGNKAVVKRLLQHEHVRVDRAAKDSFGNTPLLSAATSLVYQREQAEEAARSQKNRAGKHRAEATENANCASQDDLTAIQSLLAPWSNPSLTDEARAAAESFNATVVKFGKHHKRGHKIETPTVHKILYEADKHDATQPAMSTNLQREVRHKDSFRWIHLPANNTSWCLDFLTKHFIENGSRDVDGFKELQRSFNHQHQGQQLHSRYMSPLCQTILRTHRNTDPETLPPPSRSPTLEDDTPLASAVHTTQNAQTAILDTVQESSPTSAYSMAHPHQFHVENDYFPNATAKKKKAGQQEEDEDQASISHMYLFMPYLHFETFGALQKMQKVQSAMAEAANMSNVPIEPQSSITKDMPPDEILLRAHLDPLKSSLHVRRTLDQSFYHNINTDVRDRDQVIHRYQKKADKKKARKQRDADLHKVLMVDQLFLFVLGDDLVFTSCPRRWNQPTDDPLDVVESIREHILSRNQEPVRSVYEMATIITAHCFRAYHNHGIRSDEEQFLDMFEASIGATMEEEVRLFREFEGNSHKAWTWMQDFDKASSTPQGPDKGTSTPPYVTELLNIANETKLLKEIKDIRDELDMLDMVFSHQAKVLPIMQHALETICDQKRQPAIKQRATKAFNEYHQAISHPREDIERMVHQSDRVYQSINDLLDLKQKHANAIEARYARQQAESTAAQAKQAQKLAESAARQSQTVMVFTLVTVIFLPLSFVAAFFAIPIDEFPRDSNQMLPFTFITKYMFGVGLPIAIVISILALYIGDLPGLWSRLVRKEKTVPAESGLTLEGANAAETLAARPPAMTSNAAHQPSVSSSSFNSSAAKLASDGFDAGHGLESQNIAHRRFRRG